MSLLFRSAAFFCFPFPQRRGRSSFSLLGSPASGPFRGPGGDERVRTAGLLLARQALYQLSYTPTLCVSGAWSLPSFAFQGPYTLKTVQYLSKNILI